MEIDNKLHSGKIYDPEDPQILAKQTKAMMPMYSCCRTIIIKVSAEMNALGVTTSNSSMATTAARKMELPFRLVNLVQRDRGSLATTALLFFSLIA